MAVEKNRILVASLESQLNLLKKCLENPDAAQWRQLGKITQAFNLWLERARPLIPCASRLIALRVAQISEELSPNKPSEKAVRQLMNLLNEAEHHLANPQSPIQVIDLERDERFLLLGEDPCQAGSEVALTQGRIGLPFDMVEIPMPFQPEGISSTAFRFIIPN
jgi:hypothetical protein